jgi:hypothetical protein
MGVGFGGALSLPGLTDFNKSRIELYGRSLCLPCGLIPIAHRFPRGREPEKPRTPPYRGFSLSGVIRAAIPGVGPCELKYGVEGLSGPGRGRQRSWPVIALSNPYLMCNSQFVGSFLSVKTEPKMMLEPNHSKPRLVLGIDSAAPSSSSSVPIGLIDSSSGSGLSFCRSRTGARSV